MPEVGWKVEHGYQGSKDPIYATVLSIPVILSMLFLLPHWWRTENTASRRLKTLPLLMLQLWPQYRVVRILIALWKDQEKYQKKKNLYYRDICCLGNKNCNYSGGQMKFNSNNVSFNFSGYTEDIQKM